MLRMKFFGLLISTMLAASSGRAAGETQIQVHPEKPRQEFQGMGCGAIFYEAHMTSLGFAGKNNEQEKLNDAMFRDVNTDVLELMIRHDHEPKNDDHDPYTYNFSEGDFDYCKHTLAICEAAKKRKPQMKLYAVLYTPPAWMKTNNDPNGGGSLKGTLKPGLELEEGEFIWAFLDYMRKHGQTIDYLSIANECDWPHTQPGYFMSPERHAEVFAIIAGYLDEMARRHPETPRPKLIAPNNLSAVDCAGKYLPPLLAKAGAQVDVVGCHDYDRRGHRWKALASKIGNRPLWQTESCFNGKDTSTDLVNSATEQWLAMTEAFNEGVNVWMAYDWVYPPRQGGEALIHLNWAKDFHLTKIYHGFRQWCAPLKKGMHLVESEVTGEFASGISKPGVKSSAFISPDGKHLAVHVVAVQDAPAEFTLTVGGAFANAAIRRTRTSASENGVELPAARMNSGKYAETLPPRGMVTYELSVP